MGGQTEKRKSGKKVNESNNNGSGLFGFFSGSSKKN